MAPSRDAADAERLRELQRQVAEVERDAAEKHVEEVVFATEPTSSYTT